jgi:PAS domain S-box-containing protein
MSNAAPKKHTAPLVASAFQPEGAMREGSRERLLRQELAIRGLVALAILGFHEVFRASTGRGSDSVILITILLGLFLNGPYYVMARLGPWPRFQAYGRMLLDIVLMTVGLYSAGGLAAAPYLAVYALVPVYAGIIFSSTACLLATGAATACYVTLVMLQQAGWLGAPSPLDPNHVAIAVFNLLIINVTGGLTAVLALALRRSRRRLRATYRELSNLMETIPDVIWVVDLGGALVLWNRKLEAVLGLSALRLRGRSLSELFSPADRMVVDEALRDGIERGQCRFEGHLLAADGSAVAYHWTGARLRDEEGQVTGLTGVGRDITERKQAEEALRQQEEQVRQLQKMEAVGQLAGGVAHDFNNLLMVIKGRAELLLQRFPDADSTGSALAAIEQAADRGTALTRQLLVFSRTQVLHRKVLDLNRVVSDTAGMLRRLISEAIEVEIRLGEELDRVRADLVQLEQVIMNLALNARDAMPRGGRLTIATANVDIAAAFAPRHEGVDPGPYVMLEVRDTGVGMDKTIQSKIFEPFFTTKEPGKGTGLGLATVYGIVKQHDGWIAVDSAPGLGATFRVYLPRFDGPAEADVANGAPSEPRRGTETVLVAEDDEPVRNVACEILRGAGYRVLEARHGTEALRIARQHPGPIDLLVTDLVMPEMNGVELAEHLRALRPDVRAFYVSGYLADASVREPLLREGARFLQKPFAPGDLTRMVGEVLGSP